MKKQHHLICIVASLLFWLVGCSAIQIKDVPVSISQAPLENEEISNSEQAESPLEAEDSTSVTITESGDFSEAEQLGFAGANIGQGGLMAGDGEWVYFRSESDWGPLPGAHGRQRADAAAAAGGLCAQQHQCAGWLGLFFKLPGWVFSLACAHGWK